MVVVGCSVRDSKVAAAICDEHQDYPLYFTAGVHPHNAKNCTSSTIDELTEILRHPRCVAVGECGLDYNRNYSPPDVQREWFDKQVKLSVELHKPLLLHCRDAHTDFMQILSRHRPPCTSRRAAVVHCFTGTAAELKDYLAAEMYIGITGWICDDRPERGGAELASLLSLIPPHRMMLETDGPYLTPRNIKPSKARPGRNEPALLPYVLAAAAEALDKSPEEVADSTTAVAQEVFWMDLDLPPPPPPQPPPQQQQQQHHD